MRPKIDCRVFLARNTPIDEPGIMTLRSKIAGEGGALVQIEDDMRIDQRGYEDDCGLIRFCCAAKMQQSCGARIGTNRAIITA